MNIQYYIGAFMMAVILGVLMPSCSGDGADNPKPKPENSKIDITTSVPVMEQKGGTVNVSFTTNDAWTVSVGGNISWVSVSPVSGEAGTHTLAITTTENDTYDERNVSLVIKAGSASQDIIITQKQKDALIVTSNKVELGSEGGEFSVEAKSNLSVSYEIEESAKEWISATEGRGLTTTTFSFTAKANDKTERRQGSVTLKGSDGKQEIVTIYQEGEEPCLVLTSEKDMTIGSEGGTLKIELESNAEIKMEEFDYDWLRQSESRAMSSYTYYIEVDANKTYDERNAAITFTNGDKKQIVTITQKQEDALIVTSNKVELGSEGGEFSVEAKSNLSVSYEIEESAKEWISATEGRGLTTTTFSFTAKANDKTERRQGTITLKAGDNLMETVTVYQEGEEISLVLTSEKDMTIGCEGGMLKIELESNIEVRMEELDYDWLRQSESRAMSSYTYYIEVDANKTYDERNAAITFTNGTQKQIVTITQKQEDALIVTSNKVELGSEGGKFSIEVKSNLSVSYEIDESVKEWISASESRGLTTTTFDFMAKTNDKVKKRQGTITLKAGDNLTETVTIYQEGEKPTLVITNNNIVVGSAGEVICVELKSNSEYSYELPDVDWIKKSESRVISTYTHYFEVLPNKAYDHRTAQIKFVNKENAAEEYVTIKQMQLNAIVIAEDEYRFSGEERNWAFDVNTNVDFKATSSADWMEIVEIASRGLEPRKVSMHLKANQSTEVREATITLTGENVSQVIKVIQEPMSLLSVSQVEFIIPSIGDTIQVEVTNNGEYEYQISDVEWIKEELNGRNLTKNVHTFVILPNESYDDRNGKIKFISKIGNKELFVVVKQMKVNAIVVAQDKYRINSEANNWELLVNTNVEFDAVSSADWLKIDQTNSRGLVEKKLNISAEANASTSSREATITLSGEGQVQIVHVVQTGKTNRIKLVVEHEETMLYTPFMYGENVFGTTDWGDGTIEKFTNSRSYTYNTEGTKTATFDVYGAEYLQIGPLNSISSLVIYVDKDKNSSVEDMEIDKKEWD